MNSAIHDRLDRGSHRWQHDTLGPRPVFGGHEYAVQMQGHSPGYGRLFSNEDAEPSEFLVSPLGESTGRVNEARLIHPLCKVDGEGGARSLAIREGRPSFLRQRLGR